MYSKKQSQTLFAHSLTIYPFRQYDLLEFAKQQGNRGLDEAGECHALVLAFLRDDNTRAALKENNLKVILPIVHRISFKLNGEAYREYGSESPEYNTYELPGTEPRQFYCSVDGNNFIALLEMLAFNQGVVLKIGAEKVAASTPQSPNPTHMLGIKKTGHGVYELFDPNKGIYKGNIKDVAFKLFEQVIHYTAKPKMIGYTTTPIKSPIIHHRAMIKDDYSTTNKLISKL